MKILIYSAHNFERPYLLQANENYQHELTLVQNKLDSQTVSLSKGHTCISAFVTDDLDSHILTKLAENGVKLIALRSKGYDHIDLHKAKSLGMKIVRVPHYSPYSVAEFTLALILTLNRKIYKSYARMKEGNFSLDGLVGFDLHGKTVGVIGTGSIGKCVVRIMTALGCKVLAYDINPDYLLSAETGLQYCSKEQLFSESHIITLHTPLNSGSKHIINSLTLSMMKNNVMLINTGRGALIDTKSLINFLKNGKIGYAGLDVYENEKNFFFEDTSQQNLKDDLLARLLTFPNVLLTGHQAFLTSEALTNIAETTLKNVSNYEKGSSEINEIQTG